MKTLNLDAVFINEKGDKKFAIVECMYLREGKKTDPSLTLRVHYEERDGKFVRTSPDWIIYELSLESEGQYTEEDIEQKCQDIIEKLKFCEDKVIEYLPLI